MPRFILLCLYALASYYAQNYASIIRQGVALNYALSTILHHTYTTTTHSSAMRCTHHWCLPETSSSLQLPIVGFFVGAFSYADDVVLLAPCASAMRMMLLICCLFSVSHKLMLNPTNFRLITPTIYFNGTKLFCGPTFSFRSRSHCWSWWYYRYLESCQGC